MIVKHFWEEGEGRRPGSFKRAANAVPRWVTLESKAPAGDQIPLANPETTLKLAGFEKASFPGGADGLASLIEDRGPVAYFCRSLGADGYVG